LPGGTAAALGLAAEDLSEDIAKVAGTAPAGAPLRLSSQHLTENVAEAPGLAAGSALRLAAQNLAENVAKTASGGLPGVGAKSAAVADGRLQHLSQD
jgi:hypothetical protein